MRIKAASSFEGRNKELYTRDDPSIQRLPNDSDQQNEVQKLPVPSQVVENLSHSSESSLSLEGMEFTLRTKKRQTIEQSNFVSSTVYPEFDCSMVCLFLVRKVNSIPSKLNELSLECEKFTICKKVILGTYE